MSVVELPEHPTIKLLYLVKDIYFFNLFFFLLKSKIIDVLLSLVN